MTRDTFKAHGGRGAKRGVGPRAPRRPGRVAARVRAVCLLLCVALALGPSLLAPGRAASMRTLAAVSPQSPPADPAADFAAHSLLSVLSS
ncbi:MAG TPA: hypothetical protein VE642_03315, partial [Pyrinomonadaceae bacterium]|nr:hypothetical protein [Pyrinomonadaceae bacterium]